MFACLCTSFQKELKIVKSNCWKEPKKPSFLWHKKYILWIMLSLLNMFWAVFCFFVFLVSATVLDSGQKWLENVIMQICYKGHWRQKQEWNSWLCPQPGTIVQLDHCCKEILKFQVGKGHELNILNTNN